MLWEICDAGACRAAWTADRIAEMMAPTKATRSSAWQEDFCQPGHDLFCVRHHGHAVGGHQPKEDGNEADQEIGNAAEHGTHACRLGGARA